MHDNRRPSFLPPLRAVIATRIYSPEPAAASFRLEAIAHALVSERWDVDVLTTKPGPRVNVVEDLPQRTVEKDNGTKRGTLHVSRWPVLRDKAGYVRGYFEYLSFDLPLLFRLLFTRRPSIILVEPPPTTGVVSRIVAAIRGVPYVWYAADIWSDSVLGAGMPTWIVKAVTSLEKFAIRGASGVVTVSDGLADRVRSLGGRNVIVAPGGVDTDLYRQKTEADLKDNENPYLLYAGTASEWQGATIFARAFEGVLEKEPDASLVFVGQGTQWPDLKRIAEQINQRHGRMAIEVRDTVSSEESAALHRGATAALVSIVPHQDDDDSPYPYPTKIVAALSSGTPVLYAGPGPAVDDIRQENLGAVADYEEANVADAMVTILRAPDTQFDPQELHAWAEQNRSLKALGLKVARFMESIAATWEKVPYSRPEDLNVDRQTN